MKPFALAEYPPESFIVSKVMERYDLSEKNAKLVVDRLTSERVYRNDVYQVAVMDISEQTRFPALLWLSIKRIDREVIHDWRELQTIKNMIVGPEHEAVELYPAESRVADTANQYHLFVLADPDIRFPFGFNDRLIGNAADAAQVGAKQRERPTDEAVSESFYENELKRLLLHAFDTNDTDMLTATLSVALIKMLALCTPESRATVLSKVSRYATDEQAELMSEIAIKRASQKKEISNGE